jgi:lipopolysaccharide transport system ATP-binding protein
MCPIISVENLSKKYMIRHQKRERYASLRDVIANGATRTVGRLLHPFQKQGVDETHEEFWALKDVTFDVQQGDRIGIIGRNGAGKSTLLKILSRITEPSFGRARIWGRLSSLLEVGTGFHPELSGRENIYLNGAILGMTKAEIKKKFEEIVAFAEVEQFLDTPVKRYSSGMYVRLAFAVAAHLEPEVLIVDEVLAVGDAQFQEKCMGKMKAVGREGRTVLFVSHNIGAIRALCNRAILLEKGSVVIDKDPESVIASYVSGLKAGAANRVVESNGEEGLLRNGGALVTRVAVCNERGDLANEIYTDTPFQIEAWYTVKRNGAYIGLNLIVHDGSNNCVFGSINNHEQNWYGRPMPEGNYRSICKIPKNFFNNGLYTIGLVLFEKGFSDLASKNELLVIDIHDGKEVRGDYFGLYASCTRPLFEWVTTQEDKL